MRITVRLFAGARDAAGQSVISLYLPHLATTKQAQSAIAEQFPALARLAAVSRLAVNYEYASPDQVLTETDEVALLPPVSGGAE